MRRVQKTAHDGFWNVMSSSNLQTEMSLKALRLFIVDVVLHAGIARVQVHSHAGAVRRCTAPQRKAFGVNGPLDDVKPFSISITGVCI